MLDARPARLMARTAPPLPVAQMVAGKSPSEVAALLPRLFNLCRAAQGLAARLALGLAPEESPDALRAEILRDHVLRLAMILPGHFGQPPAALPLGWQQAPERLAPALFGPVGHLPRRPDDLDGYITSGSGLGGLMGRIAGLFGPGEAVCADLPLVDAETGQDPAARVENSCAARVAHHPVLRALQARQGRGPLWRVLARAYDLQALLQGAPLAARSPAPGCAQVPATRGLYTISAQVSAGRVLRIARVTPTDHLQAEGGVLEQTLASLAPERAALAPLVLDILDPCTPIRIEEAQHA